jgi:hypothetical protein
MRNRVRAAIAFMLSSMLLSTGRAARAQNEQGTPSPSQAPPATTGIEPTPAAPPEQPAEAVPVDESQLGGAGESCRSRADCKSTLKCFANACRDALEGASCTSRQDCGTNLKCFDGVCTSGEQSRKKKATAAEAEAEAETQADPFHATFEGLASAGAYAPFNETFSTPIAIVGPGIRGSVGYQVAQHVAIGAMLEFSPAIWAGDRGYGFNPQGFGGPYIAVGALDEPGPQLVMMIGFGGHGSPNLHGGYGPAIEPGFRYVLGAGRTLRPILGMTALLALTTRDGELMGLQAEAAFTVGFQR